MFCKHIWKEIERFIAEGSKNFEVENITFEQAKKLKFGFTTILYKCEKCGKHKTIEVFGKSIKS